MAEKVIIHVGFPKTGTTALQASLFQAQSDLETQFIIYNPPWNNAHHRAAWSLIEYVFGWNAKGGSSTPKNVWTKFVNQVNSTNGTVLISSEFFIKANSVQINRIKNEINAKNVEIIFTLRPFAKILPSRYQQSLKKGMKWSYEEWLKKVFESESMTPSLEFATKNPFMVDYAETISLWANTFGLQNVKLVLTDEANPENLYRRFEEATGISKDTLKTAKTKKLNRSLTLSEANILREVNKRRPKKWKWGQYRYFIRGNFVKYLSDNPSKFPNDPKLQLPKSVLPFIETYALDQIQKIKDLGVIILGNPAELHVDNSGNIENLDSGTIPVEMAADLVIHLSSISRLSGTSTRNLIKEVGIRLKRSTKFYIRLVGKIISIFFK